MSLKIAELCCGGTSAKFAVIRGMMGRAGTGHGYERDELVLCVDALCCHANASAATEMGEEFLLSDFDDCLSGFIELDKSDWTAAGWLSDGESRPPRSRSTP